MDAKYKDAMLRSGNSNTVINGNKVESVPSWQSRNGLTIRASRMSFSALSSYTGETFADAFNTINPSASGASGLVPSYHLVDFNSRVTINSMLQLRLNVNNVFNKSYFTKRPQFYPGPGIWPSDARSFSATLGFKY